MASRDLRDPKLLGERLIGLADIRGISLREVADSRLLAVADYNANPTCIEKYGRPQDLPTTPF